MDPLGFLLLFGEYILNFDEHVVQMGGSTTNYSILMSQVGFVTNTNPHFWKGEVQETPCSAEPEPMFQVVLSHFAL